MQSLIGATLGRYQIREQIGRGGMATVYRAHQPSLGRDVAIKVLRDSFDPAAAARFEREARAVASFHHPNILPLYDYGDEDGHRYFVTQYIPGGRTLADEVAAGALPPRRALTLMALVLDALAYAHGHGIVHRDVKPANIMLPQPDWPLLADFGIAERMAATTELTLPGQIIGTANYMAPERASDRPYDGRADLYAVGVVLFELLAGRLPFGGDSPLAVLVQHVSEPAPALGSLVPGIAPAIERAVLTAMAKDPAARFQSAAEMAAALRRLASAEEATPWPAAPPAPALGTTIPQAAPPAPVVRPAAPPAVPPVGEPAPAPTGREALPASRTSADSPTAAPSRRPSLLPLLGLGAILAALAIWFFLRGGAGALSLPLEDTAWQGGYTRTDGTYAGRSATWIYGQGSGYASMGTTVELAQRPAGEAELFIVGMDAEGASKASIVIAVNGQTIFNGPNPLPDDDYADPLIDTGTWGEHSFPFDPAILRQGRNEITISNQSPGQVGQPPFFMLDVAELRLGP